MFYNTPMDVWQTALSEKNMSIRSLARLAGISHTYLAEIVSGKKLLQIAPGLNGVFGGACPDVAVSRKNMKKDQHILIKNFRHSALARTNIISRRLLFDSLSNCRLICSAWRVHYNFLSDSKPIADSRYRTWLDIITSTGGPDDL
jgi:transcriptional regulator with XRE-family HTH domain